MTTVIGKIEDVQKYHGKQGYNVLACEDWSIEKNRQWLQEAIERGDKILFTTTADVSGQYQQELLWLCRLLTKPCTQTMPARSSFEHKCNA
jgi:hypothetical protein